MQTAVVEGALEILRPGLAADGFELRVGNIDESGAVSVILAATSEACLDCLVPDDLMVQIIESAIREQDVSLDHVDLIKEGFDGQAGH